MGRNPNWSVVSRGEPFLIIFWMTEIFPSSTAKCSSDRPGSSRCRCISSKEVSAGMMCRYPLSRTMVTSLFTFYTDKLATIFEWPPDYLLEPRSEWAACTSTPAWLRRDFLPSKIGSFLRCL